MTDHRELQELMGAYVLGGLSADDRRAFESHLETCDSCREEVLHHASLPGLLRSRPVAATDEPGPARDLLPRLLDGLAHDKATRRRRTLVAGLVAAAAVAAALVVAIRNDKPDPVDPVSVVALSPAGSSGATGESALVEKGWGTELHLSATELPGDGPFRLVVVAPDGSRQLAATWGPTPGGGAQVTGATSFTPHDIAEVRVLDPSGAVLVGAHAVDVHD